jgi:hypothetical protein
MATGEMTISFFPAALRRVLLKIRHGEERAPGMMLAELLVQNHREQARSRPAPRNHMERRRRLADFLAIPAGELFAHRFDHLHVGDARGTLALGALAYKSAYRRHPRDSSFRRQFDFCGVSFQLFERQRQLVDQPR